MFGCVGRVYAHVHNASHTLACSDVLTRRAHTARSYTAYAQQALRPIINTPRNFCSVAGFGRMAEHEECRLCLEGEDGGPLVQPCACRGSAKLVHRHCLKRWRRESPKKDAAYRCGQCMDHYRDALSLELLSARLQTKRATGQSTRFTLDTLAMTLAKELQAQGKYDEAEPLFQSSEFFRA